MRTTEAFALHGSLTDISKGMLILSNFDLPFVAFIARVIAASLHPSDLIPYQRNRIDSP